MSSLKHGSRGFWTGKLGPPRCIQVFPIGRKLPGAVLIKRHFVISVGLPVYLMARCPLSCPVWVFNGNCVTDCTANALHRCIGWQDTPGYGFNHHMSTFRLPGLSRPDRRITGTDTYDMIVLDGVYHIRRKQATAQSRNATSQEPKENPAGNEGINQSTGMLSNPVHNTSIPTFRKYAKGAKARYNCLRNHRKQGRLHARQRP